MKVEKSEIVEFVHDLYPGIVRIMVSARDAGVVALIVLAIWGAGIPAAAARDLEDLLWDLQIVPLDDPSPPFTLEAVDGGRRSLAEFRGRPVMLYFWESG